MIREATINDSGRIAEIEVFSSRFAYKSAVADVCLYKDMSVENRIPVYQRWISEKRFELYVNEDPDTGIIKGMMGIGMCEDGSEMLQFFEQKGKEKGCAEYVIWVLEDNGMGRSFYEKHNYRSDGKEKIFRRWNKREIRYVKG